MGFILVTNLLKLGLNGTGTFVLVFQLNLEFINKIRILPKKKKKKKKEGLGFPVTCETKSEMCKY